MKLAGGAAAGAVAASVSQTSPASAYTGDHVVLGASNSPSSPADTTTIASPSNAALMNAAVEARNVTNVAPGIHPALRRGITALSCGDDTNYGHRVGVYSRAEAGSSPYNTGCTAVLGLVGGASDYLGENGDVAIHGRATAGQWGGRAILGYVEGAHANSQAIIGIVEDDGTGVVGYTYRKGTGVHGTGGYQGTGVRASGYRGVALEVVTGGTSWGGRIRQELAAATGPPTTSPAETPYSKGEMIRDQNGDLYLCVAGGAAGTWQKVATTAPGHHDRGGSMNLLSSPIRILDTRGNGAPITHGNAKLAAGEVLTVQVTGTAVGGVSVPPTAKGAIGNVTVFAPAGGGDLRLFPANVPVPVVSQINYEGTTVAIANSFICGLSPAGALKIQCDNAACHVIVDISGFIF